MTHEQFKPNEHEKEAYLRQIILEKEAKGIDASVEKIELIESKYNINYTQDEKEEFDAWKERIPKSSLENPLIISKTQDILEYLPQVPNYTGKEVDIVFQPEKRMEENEIDALFDAFCYKDPSFEISAVIFPNNILTISIGSKTRTHCEMKEGSYYAHSHPTKHLSQKINFDAPQAFVSGLLPSPGDIRGDLKLFEMIKDGTKIFSKFGKCEIKFHNKMNNSEVENKISKYKDAYFDLFLGKAQFSDDTEIIKYLRDEFSIEISFLYKEASKNDLV